MSKRCVGCMKLKEKSPVCEHCGYNEYVPNEPHQLPIGTILQGRYQIGKVLGQGGFGITYIGWDLSLETVVAIKEFYPGSIVNRDCSITQNVACNGSHVDELFTLNRDRFLREARILAKLSHVPGIVRVQNLFGENNTAYIVMEYVEGIDLKHYIRMQGRVLTVEETFAVMRPVMYALSRVHEAELVHRDISPDNIMIQKDGSIVLLDFGAAREVANADVHKDLTRSTQTILKHGFAPIEQYRSRGNLGPWTDIYALCATMYYCLTGKVPSEAPERVIGEDNVNWRQIPGLTETQIAALEQGLAMIPEKRIQTVKELYQALYGHRVTTVAQQPSKLEPPAEKTVEEPIKEPEKAPEKRTAEYPTHTVALEEPAPKAKEPVSPVKPVVMETKQRNKKPVWMIVAAMFAVVAAVGVFVLKPKEEITEPTMNVPETTVGVVETHEVPVPTYAPLENPTYSPDAWKNNILMESPSTNFEGISLSDIITITFLDTTKDAPSDSWDVSATNDRRVLAWAEPHLETTYTDKDMDVYIAADGGINAEKACSNLFLDHVYMEEVRFNNCFHTDYVTNMSNMFSECYFLQNIDISNWNTSNVNNMSNMFRMCQNLHSLSLENWDTTNVTSLNSMFYNCEKLSLLNLNNWNVSKVKDMECLFAWCNNLNFSNLGISSWDMSHVENYCNMFWGCSQLSSLEINSWNTASATNMKGMFESCSSLTKLDVSNWDVSNVTDVSNMFLGCNNLSSLDLSQWDISKIENYDSFLPKGMLINGKPWEELFQTSASKIVLQPKYSDISLHVYYTYQLELLNGLNPYEVEWSSEHENIASVSSNGVVTAKKVGVTEITAKYGNQTATIKIRVRE